MRVKVSKIGGQHLILTSADYFLLFWGYLGSREARYKAGQPAGAVRRPWMSGGTIQQFLP
jgi:hypothetical protein